MRTSSSSGTARGCPVRASTCPSSTTTFRALQRLPWPASTLRCASRGTTTGRSCRTSASSSSAPGPRASAWPRASSTAWLPCSRATCRMPTFANSGLLTRTGSLPRLAGHSWPTGSVSLRGTRARASCPTARRSSTWCVRSSRRSCWGCRALAAFSPRASCAPWPNTATARSSFPCPTRRRTPSVRRTTCRGGRTVEPSLRVGLPLTPSTRWTARRPTPPRRPTTSTSFQPLALRPS
mmetsp:Transcript_8893/g.28389  ORF Transcript_8893/g.28389 Transcript_8893/m.28389 type:complete len:237 (-) Transcript_8893:1150-1860(-)